MEHTKRKSISQKTRLLIAVAVLVILAIVFLAYTASYYHADERALEAMASDDAVSVEKTSYGYLFDGPSATDCLIFYPGGKVEETAYAPLLREIAAAGVDVCLVKMPLRLAVFGENRAEKVISKSSYLNYYICGHSLGGAMAADYAASRDGFAGLILLAAYPTKELPESLPVISIVGSEDGVVNKQKVEAGRALVKGSYREYEIEGGNHALFGSYGEQKGDGTATITPAEQWAETARIIMDNIAMENIVREE